ncbi:hypothetical protein MMC29_006342 [Sticta canariensis]|nr:hypothetical protein [Sticta canariensis]
MNLIFLPPEVRAIIYDLCFPPVHSQVQLIPYRVSLPACHLNLPLPLYCVCKLIYAELPPLATKLRTLDLHYIIRGAFIGPYFNTDDGPRRDDDPDLAHFQTCLRFAERLRLVGPEATITDLSKIVTVDARARVCGARPGSAAGYVGAAVTHTYGVVVSRAASSASGCREAAASALNPG